MQLPVPIAIFILMYRERLFTCGSDPSRRLLDGDVLAMKTWGTTGLTEDAGHQKETSRSKFVNLPALLHHWHWWSNYHVGSDMNAIYTSAFKSEIEPNMPLDVHIRQKGCCCCNLPAVHSSSSVSAGHIDLFSCCLLGNAHGFPSSFFGIHILGGLVLFFSDGIVVSRISRISAL